MDENNYQSFGFERKLKLPRIRLDFEIYRTKQSQSKQHSVQYAIIPFATAFLISKLFESIPYVTSKLDGPS